MLFMYVCSTSRRSAIVGDTLASYYARMPLALNDSYELLAVCNASYRSKALYRLIASKIDVSSPCESNHRRVPSDVVRCYR